MNNELNYSAPTDPINIFIGHRWDCKRSKEAAQVIKEKFNMYSEHLNFLLLSEVPAGKSERDWIRECMDKTHMMFLLCACPNESGETWAWGTLEVGWFESWSEGVKKRGDGTHLYIFHSPAVLLPPALNIHKSKACVAVPPKIKLFLKDFFGNAKRFQEFGYQKPLNKLFADNEKSLNEVSEAVCKCFLQLDEVKDIKFHPFTNHDEFLLLRIKDIEALEKGIIPDTTSIEASGDNTLKLFGLSKVPPMAEKWMWKDLKERIQGKENQKWIDEIEQSMKSAGKGYLMRQKETIFQSPHTSENYIPMLQAQRISKTEPKTFEFRISLIRQPTKGVLAPASDSRHSILLSCLILSYRFHWEVCKPYLHELHDFTPDDENDGYLKLKQIQETIDAIERESEYRRDFEATPPDPLHDRLLSAFRQSSEEHARVRENLDWQKQCKQDLKAEIKQKDTHGIIKQLQRLQQLNNQLAVMIAEQYDAALKELGTPSNRYNFNGEELEKEQE